ncbi:MAG: hypothetical protein J6S52_03510 [Prevotella sp.]|nr:hypothetical protein [Prevotella sp.]
MKKKRYIQPEAEFEEIEGMNDLMEALSPYKTEGKGSTKDNNPEDMDYEGNTPTEGTGTGEWWDPNG